jgi:very-short-patch-repair endonuclease
MKLRNPAAEATTRARRLRREMSESERKLWAALRANALGFYFRRQHPLGPYTLDFVCVEATLCVEVDGDQHSETAARDEARDGYLARHGIETLRIATAELYDNQAGVVDAIYAACCRRTGREGICEPGGGAHALPSPPTQRLPGGREGAAQTASALTDAGVCSRLVDPLPSPPPGGRGGAAPEAAAVSAPSRSPRPTGSRSAAPTAGTLTDGAGCGRLVDPLPSPPPGGRGGAAPEAAAAFGSVGGPLRSVAYGAEP